MNVVGGEPKRLATCARCGREHEVGSPCGQPSRVGELLAGKYRVTRLLGQGGMGTVYEAQHVVLGRRFAVKFLHPELVHESELLARFRREAQAAESLESENIASVVDFGDAADGVPYLLMELLVGDDLARFLAREGPLPMARAVNIIIQACRGLDAAHAAGIIHRDLKPENLFLCRRGDGSDLVKILDFGIAKLSGGPEGSYSMTRTGSTMGTPFYMPPEQARGAKELDHRADVYALGVILFEALSGEKPHPGDSYNAILYHILTQPPLALGSLRRGLPPELEDLVNRTLASEPATRPASAVQLARDLAPFAGRQLTPFQSQFELRVPRNAPTRPHAAATVGSGPAAGTPGPVPRTPPPATPPRVGGAGSAGNWPFPGDPAWGSPTPPFTDPLDPDGSGRRGRRTRRLVLGGVLLSAVAAGVVMFGLRLMQRDQPPAVVASPGAPAAPPAERSATAAAGAPVAAAAQPPEAKGAPASPPSSAGAAPTPAGAAPPSAVHDATTAVSVRGTAADEPAAVTGGQRPRGQGVAAGGRPHGHPGGASARAERTDRAERSDRGARGDHADRGGDRAAKAGDPAVAPDEPAFRPARPRRPVFDRSNPYE